MTKEELAYWKTQMEHLRTVQAKGKKQLEKIDREIDLAMKALSQADKAVNEV